MNLTQDEFSTWLTAYGSAWELRKPSAITELFAADARYYETPFDEPMTGTKAIERYWREGAEQSQRDVAFSYEVLATKGAVGWSRWRASFVRVSSGVRVEVDGMLEVEFIAPGKCICFREWWHRRESSD